jgi:hypothetical protein
MVVCARKEPSGNLHVWTKLKQLSQDEGVGFMLKKDV